MGILKKIKKFKDFINSIINLNDKIKDLEEEIFNAKNQINSAGCEIVKAKNEVKILEEVIVKAKNEIKDSLDKYSQHPIYYPWVMSKNEKSLFDKFISSSRYYLEFGSGGSTIRALQKSTAIIYSVDSNQEWIDSMEEYLVVRLHMKCRLTFFLIDIGNTKEWGTPVDDTSKHLFPKYSADVFELVDYKKIDTVFVDGRFRVACVLQTVLNVYTPHINNVVILIHDFWNREGYHVVLKYLEVVDKADTLGVFKVKNNLDIDEVKNDYNKYKFTYD